MSNEKFGGNNWSIRPENHREKPAVTDEGVVSGEIGHVEVPEPQDVSHELLRTIETEARQDAMLAEAFDQTAGEDPAVRAANVIERINRMRRELMKSDADATFKRDRDLWLSQIANRLRELL